ncbi:hypothetical protein, partial [Xenorhabdus bovienii]|uniref:hypothetical protein n=1 Tax=Xenorhabdus bovienii TaxID=40576 RepID=UPI0023B312DD
DNAGAGRLFGSETSSGPLEKKQHVTRRCLNATEPKTLGYSKSPEMHDNLYRRNKINDVYNWKLNAIKISVLSLSVKCVYATATLLIRDYKRIIYV